MKFRDPKTGEMCGIQGLLWAWIRFRMHRDTDWAKENAEEVASLMGYEVVYEPGDDTSPLEVIAQSFSQIEKGANVDKPLKDWTLGETKQYCESQGGYCAGCLLQKNHCELKGCPEEWNLSEKPRFTEQEAERARTIKVICPDADRIRCRISENKGRVQHVCEGNRTMLTIWFDAFPSIQTDEYAKLDEIIGGAE